MSLSPTMTLHRPGSQQLAESLQNKDRLLVACLCAAWCDTCTHYKPKIQALAQQYPDICFVWIDIEDDADLLGDEDIENFPTILIEQAGEVRFTGPILPHIEHLDRLINATLDSHISLASPLSGLRQRIIALYP